MRAYHAEQDNVGSVIEISDDRFQFIRFIFVEDRESLMSFTQATSFLGGGSLNLMLVA